WSVSNIEGGKTVKGAGSFDMNAHPVWQRLYESWEKKEEFQESYLAGKEKEDYVSILNANPAYLSRPIREFPDLYREAYNFNEGALWTYSLQPHADAEREVMKRFASVFSLTFRRYQDLKKAEAQAREAQIEAGLERVRSRTMAMHKSDELAETAVVLFKQMIGLGIEPNRLYIAIINDNSGDLEFWITDENGEKLSSRYMVNIHKNISIKKMYEGWASKKKAITIDMQGKELEDWLTYWQEEFHVAFKPGAAMKRRVQNIAYFSKGFIAIASSEDQPETTINLLERFAAVFNLTYTRFSDLQQAEGQAREATIEAALEKVRGKAMAMHNSNDLSVTASMVFTELRKLGINSIRCGVGILTKNSRRALWYSATAKEHDDSLSLIGESEISGHPEFDKQYESWLNNKNYFTVLRGEDLKSYYAALYSKMSHWAVTDIQNKQEEHGYYFAFSLGFLYSWTDKPYLENEINILNRFKAIIDLTFRRYMELQKSEANAREA